MHNDAGLNHAKLPQTRSSQVPGKLFWSHCLFLVVRREGSYGTQAQRERELTLIANQLNEIGFRGMNSHSLKPKHVEGLVRHWLENEVATGTIKNRMAAFRWWARKVNRQNVVARSNIHAGPGRMTRSSVQLTRQLLRDTVHLFARQPTDSEIFIARSRPAHRRQLINLPFSELSIQQRRVFARLGCSQYI